MDLDNLAQLFKESIQFLPQPQELALFSIGGRGYFENPTTDLLAFFFDPHQAHGFRDLLLRSFITCMGLEIPDSLDLSEPPQREEITSSKNRLDLLLISENWVLAIENKIRHAQQNPFDDYERHLKTRFPEKKIYMAILSPLGTSTHPSWIPVSYKRFIVEVITRLGTYSIQTNFTKWFVFLREFLIHLENEATERAMEDKQVEFVEKNYTTISQLIELREKSHKIIEQKGRSVLEELFPQSPFSVKVHS
jgi:PD-(D/E)XK nuclease superfamily